jgi:hypothetical protein
MCNLAKVLILKLEISIPRIVETSNLFLESFFHLLLSTGAGRHWIGGGGKGGGNTEGAQKKRFWHDSIFSCNRRLQESFSVCSVKIVSLRYG